MEEDPLWWKARGDFEHTRPSDKPGGRATGSDYEDGSVSSRENSTLGSLDAGQLEKRTAHFTEYSMSSSVVPRSEGLCNNQCVQIIILL